MSFSLFDFTGFAARTDIEEDDWKAIFDGLEQEQSEFLQYESKFRSKEYRWPRDPLHSWSRLWEYPYVYNHINRIHAERPGEKLELIDFGSGVTFFPFALTKLDCNVTCVDIDPIVAVDIPLAAEALKPALGHVKVALIKNGCIPVESESQDVVYCISVLEHIQKFEWVIEEISRVLKPDGQLILTVDIDLRGNSELGVKEFEDLQAKLDEHFVKKHHERPVHPSNLLTTASSTYHTKSSSPFFPIKQLVKGFLRGQLINGDPRVGVFLAVHAAIYQKRMILGA